MKTIEEINMLVKSAAQKKANWLTDFLLVRPLTRAYTAQNEAYKSEMEKKRTTPPLTPAKKTESTHSLRTDALTQIAQNVSNAYRPGSIAKPKIYSGGKCVVK